MLRRIAAVLVVVGFLAGLTCAWMRRYGDTGGDVPWGPLAIFFTGLTLISAIGLVITSANRAEKEQQPD